MRRGLGLGAYWELSFPFPGKLYLVPSELWQDWSSVVCRKVGISRCECIERGGNEQSSLSLGQDDNSSGQKRYQRLEAGETILGSFVFGD